MPAKTNYSVVVKDVSKVYRSESIEVDALIDVSFSLKQGEFVAIVGPSGSGKSTLMHILGTIDKPTMGEVYIDGIATSEMDGDRLAEFRNNKLGFVFQAFNLVNGLDAEMNVEFTLLVFEANTSISLKEDLCKRTSPADNDTNTALSTGIMNPP
jgi:putative ABC transport system ATP-binding protein